MRAFLFVALLVTVSAVAQDSSFLKGEALQADVVKNCADGCITFNPAEAAELERQVSEFAQQAAQRAYEMGKADANTRCASLI